MQMTHLPKPITSIVSFKENRLCGFFGSELQFYPLHSKSVEKEFVKLKFSYALIF